MVKTQQVVAEDCRRPKGVQELPISKESVSKLKSKGITQASDVLKIYQSAGSKEEFFSWMMETCKAETKDCESCYKALRQNPASWC